MNEHKTRVNARHAKSVWAAEAANLRTMRDSFRGQGRVEALEALSERLAIATVNWSFWAERAEAEACQA